ncbi:hypothetical protein G6F65_022808 [Rhizopus arrhizus]|nr:hypothetical protein G6F65_022808 [Rhizopus arrhizus]
MHRALHTGQRPLAPLHDRPAGLGEGGHEHDDERQHGQQDHEADAAGIERGGPRTHAHGGWRAALRHARWRRWRSTPPTWRSGAWGCRTFR